MLLNFNAKRTVIYLKSLSYEAFVHHKLKLLDLVLSFHVRPNIKSFVTAFNRVSFFRGLQNSARTPVDRDFHVSVFE